MVYMTRRKQGSTPRMAGDSSSLHGSHGPGGSHSTTCVCKCCCVCCICRCTGCLFRRLGLVQGGARGWTPQRPFRGCGGGGSRCRRAPESTTTAGSPPIPGAQRRCWRAVWPMCHLRVAAANAQLIIKRKKPKIKNRARQVQ